MINTKEYNEILLIFKELIMTDQIKITDESFSISAIKAILQTHPRFQPEILALKEKSKNVSNLINIFASGLVQNKKKYQEIKLLLSKINDLSILYNEPRYLQDFNIYFYDKLLSDIKEKDKPLISKADGNFIEKMFNMKQEMFDNMQFAQISPTFILNEIYKIINPNIGIDFDQNPNISKFKFKLNGITLLFLKQTFLNIIQNNLNTNEEQINAKKRRDTIKQLINENKNIQLLELIKTGVPNSMRKNIYLSLLEIEKAEKIEVDKIDNILLADYYLLRDAHKITASENYFLFEEELIKLLAVLIRDPEVINNIQGIRPIFTIRLDKNKEKEYFLDLKDNNQNCIPYPPSGIFPFQGLAFQLAPFTYMSTNMEDYYLIAREFYNKYLSFLTSFISNRNSILSLLCSFDSIFLSAECFNELRNHLNQVKYDINQIVIYWFLTSFATIFCPQNVFKIYDLVIISHGLSVYVLVALSLIYYKKDEVKNLESGEDIEECFADICYEHFNCYEIINAFLTDSI